MSKDQTLTRKRKLYEQGSNINKKKKTNMSKDKNKNN